MYLDLKIYLYWYTATPYQNIKLAAPCSTASPSCGTALLQHHNQPAAAAAAPASTPVAHGWHCQNSRRFPARACCTDGRRRCAAGHRSGRPAQTSAPRRRHAVLGGEKIAGHRDYGAASESGKFGKVLNFRTGFFFGLPSQTRGFGALPRSPAQRCAHRYHRPPQHRLSDLGYA